jgi:hypothetical protein
MVTEEESKIMEEWLRLIEQYANEFELISSRPVHFKAIAAFPGILPEHGIHSIKDAILKMGSVRESPSQIAMDWTNKTNMEHITDSNFAMLSTESVSSLSCIVTESPISLPFGQVQRINVNEIDNIFHQEAIQKHSNRMQFQQVLLVQGAPTWSDVDTTTIHPPTTPGEEDHSDLTIASFFKIYQANGTIRDRDYDTALFKDVLTGNVSSSIVMEVSQMSIQAAQHRMIEVKTILQETIGPTANITVAMWPEISQELDEAESKHEQLRESIQDDNQDHPKEEQEGQSQGQVESNHTQSNSSRIQGNTDLNAEVSEIKQVLVTLTKLIKEKESLTAPLTTVTASSNGEVSPISSITLVDLSNALYDVFERAYKEDGFLYKNAKEENERLADNIVQMLRDAIAETTPIMQDSVRELVEETPVANEACDSPEAGEHVRSNGGTGHSRPSRRESESSINLPGAIWRPK